jgi:hypothetical protein
MLDCYVWIGNFIIGHGTHLPENTTRLNHKDQLLRDILSQTYVGLQAKITFFYTYFCPTAIGI